MPRSEPTRLRRTEADGRSRSASRFRLLFALPRPGSGEWLPLTLGVLLAVVLVGELVAPWRTEPDPPPGLAPRRLRPPIGAPIPEYPAILRAPVFRADRAPGEFAGPGEAAASSATLQLLGVGGAPGSGTAVVKTADGATHGLRPGRAVPGWRLLAVDPSGATFAGPTGRVRLTVGAQAGAPPSPAAASPKTETPS